MAADSIGAFKAPLYLAWELTHVCNAKCLHCYSESGPSADCSDELNTDESLAIIDQLADAGLVVLAFSGGEPLIRKDWRRLVAHAVRRGLAVNVGSNGSLITETVGDDLKDLGVKSVTISLDSHKPESHDYFRQYPGLHKVAVRAISLLASKGIRVVVGFTPTKLNWKDGPEVVELAKKLGASAVNLSEYVPSGRGPLALALSPDELRETLEQWIRLRKDFKGVIEVIWHDCRVGMLVPDDERRGYVGCGAGRLVARILPNGTVTPCVFLSTAIGSLRTSSFAKMWADCSTLTSFRERAGHVTGNCGDCEYLATCGGCRAVAFAYSGGNPLAGDPHCWIKRDNSAMAVADLPGGESLPV